MVTSTADNCLGSECPFWSDCFVVQARQRAQAADIVVVNHHLLLADLALKQEGFGEILPGAQAFVVDEAHQLPDLAAQFFGEGLGARPLVELARDALAECKDVDGALAAVQEPARDARTRHARAARGDGSACRRAARAAARCRTRRCAPRSMRSTEALAQLRRSGGAAGARRRRVSTPATRAPTDCAARLARCAGDAHRREAAISTAKSASRADDDVRWYELSPRGFRLQRTPLDVSGPLREHRETFACGVGVHLGDAGGRRAASITSRTRLGLDDPPTLLAAQSVRLARAGAVLSAAAPARTGRRAITASA